MIWTDNTMNQKVDPEKWNGTTKTKIVYQTIAIFVMFVNIAVTKK